MLLPNRPFAPAKTDRTAKSIYIFAEGVKTEKRYFDYFRAIDSRINIEVYPLNSQEDNSPKGLLNIAKRSILVSKDNPNPKYSFQKNDEVWIVLDIDPDKANSRAPQIAEIKTFSDKQKAWQVVQSNPCFEVWLYYHLHQNKPDFQDIAISKGWKQFLNQTIKGGFQAGRHPLLISDAVSNAKATYEADEKQIPTPASTQVYELGESMLTVLKTKIDKIRAELEI